MKGNRKKVLTYVMIGLFLISISVTVFIFKSKGATTATLANSPVSITNSPKSMKVGESYQLKSAGKNVSWSSGDTKVATVDKNGKVTAKSAGVALINVYSNNNQLVFDYVTFKVEGKLKVSSVKITNVPKVAIAGNTVQLGVTVLPTNLANKSVTWSSGDTKVATVDSKGLVTLKSAGKALIVASSNVDSTVFDYVVFNVTGTTNVKSVKINNAPKSIKVGSSAQLSATVLPTNLANKSVTWSSSNTKIATVSSSGKVTAKKAGTVKITATSKANKKITNTVSIKVESIPKAKSIKIKNIPKTIYAGQKFKLTAEVLPSNAVNKAVLWKSSDNNIATVDGKGQVVAKKVGKVKIAVYSAADKTINTSVQLNIQKKTAAKPGIPEIVNAESINIINNPNTMKTNKSFKLETEIKPANTTNQNIIWSTSDVTLATIDKNGTIKTYNRTGTVKITATVAGTKISNSIDINIISEQNRKVQFKSAPQFLFKGKDFTFKTNIGDNTKIKWISSDSNIVSVDKNGKIKAINPGRAIITAQIDNNSTQMPIEVVSVSYEKDGYEIYAGDTSQIKAVVYASPSFDIKGLKFGWDISDTSIAKITSQSIVPKPIESKNLIQYSVIANVYAKTESSTTAYFLMSSDMKTFNIKVVSKLENLKLRCPTVKYENSKLTVAITDKAIKSWDYYITSGKTGSNASWKYSNKYVGSQTIDYPKTVRQAKIVIHATDGSSRNCYTLPYKEKIVISDPYITKSNIECPAIETKILETSGTRRTIDRTSHIWYTGVKKINVKNVLNVKKGMYPNFQYSWYLKGEKPFDGKTFNYQNSVDIPMPATNEDLWPSLLVMNDQGDVNICNLNKRYTSLDLSDSTVIDGINVYFEKGFSRSQELIKTVKDLPKYLKMGASIIVFYTDKSYVNNLGNDSAGRAWGSNIAIRDGRGDYNKYTVVHELGHTLDVMYSTATGKGTISNQKDVLNLYDELQKKKKDGGCDEYEYLRKYAYKNELEFMAEITQHTYFKEYNVDTTYKCPVNKEIINIKNKYFDKLKKFDKVSEEIKSKNGKEIKE